MAARLVTFCAPNMSKAAELCLSSAKEQGIEHCTLYTQDDLRQTEFYKNHQSLLDAERGAGWWIWKPWALNEEMRKLSNGKFLIYCDAGVKWIDSAQHILFRMDQDLFLFGNEWQHAHWCKRDIIEAINPWLSQLNALHHNALVEDYGSDDLSEDEAAWRGFGKQAQASVIFIKVTDYSRAFIKEWLDWCAFEGGRLVDDSPSRAPNHPEFRENRYDQAILTTMAYRDGLKLHGWFVRYETYEPARAHYPDDTYPTLFLHHRIRNDDWENHQIA